MMKRGLELTGIDDRTGIDGEMSVCVYEIEHILKVKEEFVCMRWNSY